MKVEFLKRFNKDAKKISVQSVRNEVIKAIENVESAVNKKEIKGLKKLSGYKNEFRIRIGDYRRDIFIVNDTVHFAHVVHRKDIYKFFP
jgi:mRNA interferase RelE/StbE